MKNKKKDIHSKCKETEKDFKNHIENLVRTTKNNTLGNAFNIQNLRNQLEDLQQELDIKHARISSLEMSLAFFESHIRKQRTKINILERQLKSQFPSDKLSIASCNQKISPPSQEVLRKDVNTRRY